MIKPNLFIDSGAFSANSSGTPVDLDEYMEFLLENEEHFTVYANLDAIGNPELSWRNQQYYRSNMDSAIYTHNYAGR